MDVFQKNTAIYQDIFSCVPNDTIHTRYVWQMAITIHFWCILSILSCPDMHSKRIIVQSCFQTKHSWLERKNWPHNYWYRNCSKSIRIRISSKWTYQDYRSLGEISFSEGPSCFFPVAVHVSRKFKTCLQWKWILRYASFLLSVMSESK